MNTFNTYQGPFHFQILMSFSCLFCRVQTGSALNDINDGKKYKLKVSILLRLLPLLWVSLSSSSALSRMRGTALADSDRYLSTVLK